MTPSKGAKSNATKQPRPKLVAASHAAGELGIAQRPGSLTVDIDLIAPNPQQPRSSFDPESLATLTDSIRQHGLLQPLIVSRQQSARGGVSYQLIAGERRLHAARALGRALAAARDPLAARVRPLAWGCTAAPCGTLASNAFYLTMQFYYFYAFMALALAEPVVFARNE